MAKPLDRFSGKIFRRGDGAYGAHRYQYAFSSYAAEGRMEPAAILYPRSTEDVLLAIEHARRHSLSLAIRTGGHQMSGASSTSGANVLLDLRETYPAFEWDPRQGRVRVGVSHSLGAFNALLGERGLFVPHGQCSHVRLGGHVQTGGYGMLARSFGLLSDYVEAIEIITADGEQRHIRRDSEDREERDLFFATLGGSPGSFGVLTHVHLRPLHDEDHPNARGLKFVLPYSRQRLRALLDLVVEMASDDDFPRDVDFSVTALGGAQLNLPFATSPGVDERMRVEHPEVYGRSEIAVLPTSIAVYAQWANTRGPGQRFDPTFFRRIKAAAGYGSACSPDASGFERVRDSLRIRSLVEAAENRARLGTVRVGLGFEAPMPISALARNWMFQNVREFDLPYIKRSYLSDSRSLETSGWASWASDRLDALVAPDNGCKGFLQVQHLGGRQSRFRENGLDDRAAHSWRTDTTLCWLMDCFYDEHHESRKDPRQTAVAWQRENDEGAIGKKIFSGQDRRVFWGPYGNTDLRAVWHHYFDSREKYERLCAIKRRFDPEGIFSASEFGVGYGSSDLTGAGRHDGPALE